jgi:hypothetical protein
MTGFSSQNSKLKPWFPILLCGLLTLLATGVNAQAQSTDRDNPTPLAANEVKGYAPGKKVEYYYTFLAGPGDLMITIDSGAKGSFSEFKAEFFDMDAERLVYVQTLPYPGETARKVGRVTLGAQQPVLLRLTLDREAAQYLARIGGAAQFAGGDASFSGATPTQPTADLAAPPTADASTATPPVTETPIPPVTGSTATTVNPALAKISGLKKLWLKLSAAGEVLGLVGVGALHLEMKDGTTRDIGIGKIKKFLVGEATQTSADGSNLTPSGEDKSTGWQRLWLKLGSASELTGLNGRPLRLEMKDGTVQEFTPLQVKKVSFTK